MGLLGLNKNSKFKQGYYKCINPIKYIGKGPIVYRSGLELKFMLWCDKTDTILKWSSESIVIPYYDSVQHKDRKYYVDNYVEILEGNIIKKYLIEIKPHKQTLQPVITKGKRKSNMLYEQLQWVNNTDKWKFAKEFAKKHGMEFIIITEKELN
jgi:hypothetical protein